MVDGETLTLQVLGSDGTASWCCERLAALCALGWEAYDTPRHGASADAVLWRAPDTAALADLCRHPALASMAHDSALVVHTDGEAVAEETALLRLGTEAVLLADDARATARALRQAVWRKRVEQAARTAYATDLATGLPHQAQLLEHMTQLLALRGGLRASDVVASITPEAFGVLLGRLESKNDGERVAAKLVKALELPLSVAGQPCRVVAHVGLALYPDHGKDAQALLQRASAQAASVVTVGPKGLGATVHRLGGPAANDNA
jgi:hypothetical protein